MRTAIVTGGNRGIGLEVCRGLSAVGFRVVLAARDPAQGRKAAESMEAPGRPVHFAPLDLSDPASIERFPEALPQEADAPAVLVNNAGISLKGFDAGVVRRTMAVNVFGPWRLTDLLLPRLAPDARVVMVSSGMGALSCLGPALQRRFADHDLTREGLRALLEEFEQGVAADTHRKAGWPSSAYSVSKVALNALTRILAHEWADGGRIVNAVCPGWVRTGMGGSSAPRTPAEGADSIVWAAQLPPGSPSGGFFRERQAIHW